MFSITQTKGPRRLQLVPNINSEFRYRANFRFRYFMALFLNIYYLCELSNPYGVSWALIPTFAVKTVQYRRKPEALESKALCMGYENFSYYFTLFHSYSGDQVLIKFLGNFGGNSHRKINIRKNFTCYHFSCKLCSKTEKNKKCRNEFPTNFVKYLIFVLVENRNS